MNSVFADTFYWVALSNPHDLNHEEAIALDDSRSEATVVTTDEVLAEYLTFFATHPWMRARAAETVETLMRDTGVRVVPQSRESFLAGLDLYRSRLDKRYSLTDCISMVTMRREGITEALTNDRHFEQEGFRALFR